LENQNIEKSIHQQSFTTYYQKNASVSANSSHQYTLLSSQSMSASSSTLKAFRTPLISNVGGAGVLGVPGPAGDTAGHVAAAVVLGVAGVAGPGAIALDTTMFSGNTVSPISSTVASPWLAVLDSGREFRWQPVAARIRVVNNTIGSNRAGFTYIVQPTNAVEETVASATAASFANRGIFKVYQDMDAGTEDKYVTVIPRNALNAFVEGTATGSGGSLRNAFAYVLLDNQSTALQVYTIFLEIDWVLAGTQLRGIAAPHVVPNSISDRVANSNAVMRAANIIPSEQNAKEHIPALLSLHESPSLQAMTSAAQPLTRGNAKEHPLIKQARSMAGRHLGKLVDAGIHGIARIANTAFEAAADVFG
jgi:hypothetical protein